MAYGFDYESWEIYRKLGEYEEWKTYTYTINVPTYDSEGNITGYEPQEVTEWRKTGRILNAHNGGWFNYTTNYGQNVFINCVVSQKVEQDKRFTWSSGVNITDRVWERKRLNSWFREFYSPETKYTFYGSESSWSKRRKKHYKMALYAFCAIDNEFKLGLTAQEIASPAFKYGEAKADEGTKWYESFQTGSGILAVVLMVIAIVIAWVPGVGQGAFLAAWANLTVQIGATVAALAGMAASLYSFEASAHAAAHQASANRYAAAKGGSQAMQKAQEQSNALTHLIIYGGYEIYANGKLHNKNAAGSQTFNSQIAFDTTKGLRGDLPNDEIGEKMQGRYGGILGGGEKFHQNLMEVDFPLQKANFSAEQRLDTLGARLVRTNKRIAKGFTQLFEVYFNADNNGQNTYNRVYKLHTEPIKKQIMNEAFLDTLTCYSKDIMQTFAYINKNTFNEKKHNTQPLYLYFNSQTYKAFMDDEKYTLEQKAKLYIDTMRVFFDIIADAADEKFWGDLGFVYNSDYTQGSVGENATIDPEPITSLRAFSLDKNQTSLKHYTSYDTYYYISSQKVEFLGETFYTFGYNKDGTALYHADDDEYLKISEFSVLDGLFGENFNIYEKDGATIKRLFEQALTHLMRVNERGFFLIDEPKSVRRQLKLKNKTTFSPPFTNRYFAVEFSKEAYNAITTPLYVPENLKDEFANFDFSTITL